MQVRKNSQINSTDNLHILSDEELIYLARNGDKGAEENIILRYKNLVRSKARTYFLVGSDNDDIIQEGMIGLYKAVRDYNHEKMVSFGNFAELCIKRQIITAIKTATRNKHLPLNSYISLSHPIYTDASEKAVFDVASEDLNSRPEELVIAEEAVKVVQDVIESQLSDYEKNVLGMYLDGLSYVEIAERLGKQIKSIDNALQRIKRKLAKSLL